ncbi:TetR/AcrR family transcriptional regulator [Anditalea andensis]|uniref:TetR family transcriptional regulator n=1 Tax=Anditalea andensis TaxID=1048983 RepID=A0A074L4G4_9BACT|nr:TetR/AcrR family transcriptional regulator [Anditalea andensis]KEO74748.1 TetR family transcriptional regulator [Anditalea andensis]
METKKKIIEVATEQFMRYGIRSVTMDDIARQAGISKKTIYQEFSDKNQLVLETFSTALQEDKCMIEQFPQVKDGVIEHLIGMSDYMRKRFADMNPMAMNEIQRYYPEAWQVFEEFKQNHVFQEIVSLLEKGISEGIFRSEIDPQIIAMMRLEQMMTNLDPVKYPASKYNMADLQIEIFEHFLFGIFSEKGREAYLKQKTDQNEK